MEKRSHYNSSMSRQIPELPIKGHLKRNGPMRAIAKDNATTTLL